MSDDKRTIALKAEAALAAFRAEFTDMWPDDERLIDGALSVVRQYTRRRR